MKSIIQQRGYEYSYYVDALLKQYNGNLSLLINDCNKQIFQARKTQNTKWFKSIHIKKIQIGQFYLINYNYIQDETGKISNKLYAPIFTIDYRVSNNKHILYAINLDYLPFSYKKMFIQQLFNGCKQIIDKNVDADNVLNEQKLPVNFEIIYKKLKSNGNLNYCISAYDLNKINEVFVVSTNMTHVISHCHMRKINVALLKQKMQDYDKGSEISEKLNKLVEELEKTVEDYDNDVVEYYKKLKALESNYKLFENE